MPDHVGEGLAGQDVEGLLRLAAQPERFSAHDQVRLEILGLAELADEAAHLEKQAAGGGARQRQSEDCLPYRFRGVDGKLPDLAEIAGDGLGHRLALQDRVDFEAKHEYGLLDPVVKLGGDPFALLAEDLLALRLAEVAMQRLELVDHAPLVLVEPGVLDRHGDLVGECGEQAFLVRRIAAWFVGHPDHADHPLADLQRNAQECAYRGMAAGLANPVRVMEHVVGDL